MWLDILSCARQGQAAVVAGMFDETATRNQVAIIGPDEQLLATDSKRHPSRPGETFTRGTQSPAAVTERVRLLVAIWYDLDYNDVVHPVRAMAAEGSDRALRARILIRWPKCRYSGGDRQFSRAIRIEAALNAEYLLSLRPQEGHATAHISSKYVPDREGRA